MTGNSASKKFDRKKSMRLLTKRAWSGDNLAAQLFPGLNEESEAAWTKRIDQLTDSELYILLSQRASLGKDAAHLLPVVVERLEKNPLAVWRSLPGDMHTALSMLDSALWSDQPEIASRWAATLEAAVAKRGSLQGDSREVFDATLEMAKIQQPFIAATFERAKRQPDRKGPTVAPSTRNQLRKNPSKPQGSRSKPTGGQGEASTQDDLVNEIKRMAKETMKNIDEMTRKTKGKK